MTFQEWLIASNYRKSTVRQTMAALKRARTANELGNALPKNCTYDAQRVLAFYFKKGASDAEGITDDFANWLQSQGVEAVEHTPRAVPKRRKRIARSLDTQRWMKLRAGLEASKEREDLVLLVIFRTGLRIGDVLRTPRAEIAKGLRLRVIEIERKGGYFVQVPMGSNYEAWERLYAPMKKTEAAETVAGFLCPENDSALPGDCAYKRVFRRLKFWEKKLRCEESLHPHRLRRTLAVAALRKTGDIVKVQQLLNHKNITSTQQYTDELREDDVSNLIDDVHGEE
jgi:integrase/recombinase XerC